MKIHLVSGGCGFVGRNMVKRLYETTNDTILFIDNLLVGTHPTTWLDAEKVGDNEDIEVFGKDERLLFLKEDFRRLLTYMTDNPRYIQEKYKLDFDKFNEFIY